MKEHRTNTSRSSSPPGGGSRSEQFFRELSGRIQRHSRRARWLRAVTALAAVVVFVTTYSLIFPAITMRAETYCGFEDHVHTEECYTRELICTLEETGAPDGAALSNNVENNSAADADEAAPDNVENNSAADADEAAPDNVENDSAADADEAAPDNVENAPEPAEGDTYNNSGEGHVHTDKCYAVWLSCGKEQHRHTDECYKKPEGEVPPAPPPVLEEQPEPKPVVRELSLSGETDSGVGVSFTALSALMMSDTDAAALGLSAREIPAGSAEYEEYLARAREVMENEMNGDAICEITGARFFDISVINAEGDPVEIGGSPARVELSYPEAPAEVKRPMKAPKALAKSSLTLPVDETAEEGVSIIHFGEEGDEVLTDEGSPESDAKGHSFETAGFSVFAVLETKTLTAKVITARGESFAISVKYGPDAAIPAGARLEARELEAGTREFEEYVGRSMAELGGENGPELIDARFFDISILDEGGARLEPAAPVRVEMVYDNAPEIGVGQTVTAVHFAESGVELITPKVTRDDEAEVTAVSFTQSSFSVTGTVLTGSRTSTDTTSLGFPAGFPTEPGNYILTIFKADSAGTQTLNGQKGDWWMLGFGGVMSRVEVSGGKVTIPSPTATVADEWMRSFIWAYHSLHTNLMDNLWYGNYLNNEVPFENPSIEYKGGIQSLRITDPYLNDWRNLVTNRGGYIDTRNYADLQTDPVTGKYVSGTARFGPFAGWSTLVSGKTLEYTAHGLFQAERPVYIDDSGQIRAAAVFAAAAYDSFADRTYYAPIKDGNGEDPVLVIHDKYWKWLLPDQLELPEYDEAYVPTELRFSDSFVTNEIGTAEPGQPMVTQSDGYELGAPEIDKAIEPNHVNSDYHNQEDGTYTLALSVTGQSHRSMAGLDADVLLVVDVSGSMAFRPGTSFMPQNGEKSRFEIATEALTELTDTLLAQNTAAHPDAIRINMFTFSDNLNNDDGAWVNTKQDFESEHMSRFVLPPGTGTNWERPLQRAYDMLMERKAENAANGESRATYLIFLTDGSPNKWVAPSESMGPNGYDWNFDATWGGSAYYGEGNDDPMNAWYAFQEARDEARAIVWGITGASRQEVYDKAIYDAQNNSHINPDGTTEDPFVFMYSVAAMGEANVLANLMAYAYNGSPVAKYPSNTFTTAMDEQTLHDTFEHIAMEITQKYSYTDVEIYDPITAFTQIPFTFDPVTDEPIVPFSYYRYQVNLDGDVYDPDQDPADPSETPRFKAHRQAGSTKIDYYEDTWAGTPRWPGSDPSARVVKNLYERIDTWDRVVTVDNYVPDGNGGWVIGAPVTRTVADAVLEERDYAVRWGIELSEPVTGPDGLPTTRYFLDEGVTYAVSVPVWTDQVAYDFVNRWDNGIGSLEEDMKSLPELAYFKKTNERTVIGVDGKPKTLFDYLLYTNRTDELSGIPGDHATVTYRQTETVTDETGSSTVIVGDPGEQAFVNPDPIPVRDTNILVEKKWDESLDHSKLSQLVEEDPNYHVELILLWGSHGDHFAAETDNYYDPDRDFGSVYGDGETPWIDSSGNPVIDPATGEQLYGPAEPYVLKLKPTWHKDDSIHSGHVVVTGMEKGQINLSTGLAVSNPSGFDASELDTMDVTFPAGVRIPGEAAPAAVDTVKTFYVLEEGWHYMVRELNRDPAFTLMTDVYHPMMLDGVLFDVKCETDAMGNYVSATVHNHNGWNPDGTAADDGHLNTLVATNILRPHITLEKMVLGDDHLYAYRKNHDGTVKTSTGAIVINGAVRTQEFKLRPEEEFTVRVELTVPERIKKLHRINYVIYPEYLDIMHENGVISKDELDAYINHVLGSNGESHVINNKSYPGGRVTFNVDEAYTGEGTRLYADIVINPNQKVRIYNIPVGTDVHVHEDESAMPPGYELGFYRVDWVNRDLAPDGSVTEVNDWYYGPADIKAALDAKRDPATNEIPLFTAVRGDGSDGVRETVHHWNINYDIDVYNYYSEPDVVIKKVDSNELIRNMELKPFANVAIYLPITGEATPNPKADGLYEYDPVTETFFLSEDARMDGSKSYYHEPQWFAVVTEAEKRGDVDPNRERWYERSTPEGMAMVTSDMTVQPGKEYYRGPVARYDGTRIDDAATPGMKNVVFTLYREISGSGLPRDEDPYTKLPPRGFYNVLASAEVGHQNGYGATFISHSEYDDLEFGTGGLGLDSEGYVTGSGGERLKNSVGDHIKYVPYYESGGLRLHIAANKEGTELKQLKTDKDGRIGFGALEQGVYWLIETTPDGYVPARPTRIEVKSSGVSYKNPAHNSNQSQDASYYAVTETSGGVEKVKLTYEIVIVNVRAFVLPNTGGPGTGGLALAGAALAGAASLALTARKRRKE